MSSAYGLKAFVWGVLVWTAWRLFAPLHPTMVAFYWSVVVCFVVPLTVVMVWPQIAFAIGQRVMRLYRERKDWLIMRDLPLASRAAFRRVRAEHARRKEA